MKKLIINTISILALLLMVNCQDENPSFGSLDAPSNLEVNFEIVGQSTENPDGDGSGMVNFTSTATNAISYKYDFGDGNTKVVPGGIIKYAYSKNGVNTFTVTVTASGKGGISSVTTVDVTVFSNFTDEESTLLLTGGTSAGKKWYVAAAELGHLGVGPNNDNAEENYWPKYYEAKPFEKSSSCFYDNELTFRLEGDIIKYELNNGGNTFFNNKYKSVGGGSNGGDDECLPYNEKGDRTVTLAPSTSFVSQNPNAASQTTGTVMNIADDGFMGYYAGATQYEILSITENRMEVRFVQGNDEGLAWYQIFTTSKPIPPDPTPEFEKLVWSDEFNVDGAPNSANWSYDIGTGSNGWGNGEQQYYTDSPSNVSVQNGNLKITAIKQQYLGSNYTSARINTKGKISFKYGRIEIRAKMPSGGGTWPALWSLGTANVTWPGNGEIDYMEHKGNEPNKIYGTVHFPGNSGGNAIGGTTAVNDATAYHIYKTVWTSNTIKWYLDNVLYYTFENNPSLPFNDEFYMLMNVAMGGTFGGSIDPNFTQSSMEVDYIRVYQ